jgi:hypothetical protein
MLESLEIHGFRAFDHLRIERLGRVNLIVGKNNVGKTTLLEALWLYAHQGHHQLIRKLLYAHDEILRETIVDVLGSRRIVVDTESPGLRLAYEALFHGRAPLMEIGEPIRIGPTAAPDETLVIQIEWPDGASTAAESGSLVADVAAPDFDPERGPALVVRFGRKTERRVWLGADVRFEEYQAAYRPRARLEPIATKGSPALFVSSEALEHSEMGRLWDGIALTDLEEDVVSSLRIMAPEVMRVSAVADPATGRDRVFVARLQSLAVPVPVRSLGDGLNRLLGITLALVNAKDGILLLDEFENGLHYTVQPEVWRLIFAIAHRLNVQVFATTHSWDCIDAFQEAAKENEEVEGQLIRLDRQYGELRAVIADERMLAIATRGQIEVR